MKPIIVTFTPENAHNNLVLIDLALKSKKGGIKVAKAAMALIDLIQQATAEAQKPDAP